jgi:large subunit ribosomal protein L32e
VVNKKKKPKFLRQDWHSLKRLKRVKWRKTKGSQSKMRRGEKGKAAMPHVGYRTDKKTRSLHPSGFREVIVHNLSELQGIDTKKEAARIASKVGKKKRKEILEKAKELKIKILNPK